MQFRDLNKQYIKYQTEIDEAVLKVMKSTRFINGEEVSLLEENLAKYVGVNHCITCGNGTDALSLVLSAWGVGKGDAVFVPNFTFFASAEVVSFLGATPIFVDVDYDTFNMNQASLELKIREVINSSILIPKVIIPVDLFGLPADYSAITNIANKYNLLVLEDGAQGFGGEYKGKKACSFGDAATTSFFPAKPLGCYGDGGAIFTNDSKLAELLNSLKVHGKGKSKYDNVRIGVNSRLDTIQAAVLNVKLNAFINHELEDINNVFEKYNKLLSVDILKPHIPEGYKSSFAQYTIKLNNKNERDGLKRFLDEQNIPSMIYYTKAMHQQQVFKYLNLLDEDYPVSSSLCEVALSLPIHPYMSDEDIMTVSKNVNKFIKHNRNI